jgi:hypothetical protein
MVELLVALTMLTVGIVGVVGVMTSSFGVAVGNTDRSRAVTLATREIEALRSTPWEQLVPSADTAPRAVQEGGRTYEVERAVTDAGDGQKQATVVVRWSGGGGRVSDLRQTTRIYPGGLTGVTTTTAPSSLSGLLAAPTALLATIPTDVTGGTAVDLVWTNPVPANPAGSFVVVEWSVNNFSGSSTRLADRIASTVNRVRVPGLSAGTTYSFRVAASSAAGELSGWSPVATVTTPASASSTCSYGAASVTPSRVRRHASLFHRFVQPVTVTINTSGTCLGLHVVYQPNDHAAPQSWLLTPAAGGVWSATLPEVVGLEWSVGVHPMTIRDQLETERASLSLTVCNYGASSC